MIILEISNCSELISSKLGNFVESLTPDAIDESIVEELVVKKMIENLKAEGIKGKISITYGLEVSDDKLLVNQGLKIRSQKEV